MYSLKHIAVNSAYLCRPLLKKPVFAMRLARNYLLAARSPKRPPLRFVDIAITYNCNMRCTHCSSTVLKRKGTSPLTVDQFKIIARKLIKAGVLVVNFTGGEPFTRPDLIEIIKCFDPKKLLIAIQTNGYDVTEEKLKELKKVGVDSIGISIDGPSAETHDPFRNSPGAFEHAMKVLEMGTSIGFNMGISYCLTHENLYSTEREEIVKLSKKYKALLNYNLAVPIGFWRGCTDSLITDQDRVFLNNLVNEYPRSKTDFETNYFRRGCGAIKEKLYVTAYGDVMPCPFIQVSFGNLLTDHVEDIRSRALKYRYFSEYHPRCIAAQDLGFINNTICYSQEAKDMKMPLHHEIAFKDQKKAKLKEPSSLVSGDMHNV